MMPTANSSSSGESQELPLALVQLQDLYGVMPPDILQNVIQQAQRKALPLPDPTGTFSGIGAAIVALSTVPGLARHFRPAVGTPGNALQYACINFCRDRDAGVSLHRVLEVGYDYAETTAVGSGFLRGSQITLTLNQPIDAVALLEALLPKWMEHDPRLRRLFCRPDGQVPTWVVHVAVPATDSMQSVWDSITSQLVTGWRPSVVSIAAMDGNTQMELLFGRLSTLHNGWKWSLKPLAVLLYTAATGKWSAITWENSRLYSSDRCEILDMDAEQNRHLLRADTRVVFYEMGGKRASAGND